MIDIDAAWDLFLKNAHNLLQSHEVFVSPKEENPYCITEVNEEGVRVLRVIIGTDQTLYKKTFSRLIEELNAHNGRLPMSVIRDNTSVMQRTTFVRLLSPLVDCEDDNKYIVANGALLHLGDDFAIVEAPTDDLNEKVLRSVRKRRGQNILRVNLLYLYDNQCSITGCSVEQLLHAAHIEPHAHNGNNSSTNALLLRSDIHDLFDSLLLGIHPETCAVHIGSELRQTEYEQFEGRVLRARKDGVALNKQALELRWRMFLEAQSKVVTDAIAN